MPGPPPGACPGHPHTHTHPPCLPNHLLCMCRTPPCMPGHPCARPGHPCVHPTSPPDPMHAQAPSSLAAGRTTRAGCASVLLRVQERSGGGGCGCVCRCAPRRTWIFQGMASTGADAGHLAWRVSKGSACLQLFENIGGCLGGMNSSKNFSEHRVLPSENVPGLQPPANLLLLCESPPALPTSPLTHSPGPRH